MAGLNATDRREADVVVPRPAWAMKTTTNRPVSFPPGGASGFVLRARFHELDILTPFKSAFAV